MIENSTKVDFEKTKGIKRDCALNKLQYFHTMENFSVDLMHDIPERIIPSILHQLFQYCIEKRICSEKELVQKIQFHDYGALNR